MADPDFEGFSALVAQGATVVPVSRELVADDLTPAAAFSLFDGPGSFLLESVVGGEKWARYSFVGFDPAFMLRGGGSRFERRAGGAAAQETNVDPFQRLAEELDRWKPPAPEALASLGLPRFWGGAVGYVTYDAVRRFEPSVGELTGDDELAFSVGATLLVFDALRQTVRVIVPAHVQGDALAVYGAAVARIDDVTTRLHGARLPRLAMPTRDLHAELPPSSFERGAYEDAVRACKEYIRAGDIFQVVLSQRFEIPAAEVDSFTVYRAMRVVNPSPYMFFLRLADRSIAGASPETLVRLEDGVATVRPIAGTRHRAESVAEDERLAQELLADPKERAEHAMLVDLGRNDLGRISKTGTVRITEEMVIERYSHVMHMTSNVQGEVQEGKGPLDVLRATFPAGTLSGAPKVRAMQIIEELEPTPRGLYGGAVGYIGFDGNMDLAIAIRTMEARADRIAVQAGAGIVEASDPAKEYDETVNKARAALIAIEAARLSRARS